MKGFLAIVSAAAAVNLLAVLVLGSYDIRLGPLHFAAHAIFKPLLLADAAFWVALLLGRGREQQPSQRQHALGTVAGVALLTLGIYGLSLQINVLDPLWNHRNVSAGLNSLSDAGRLFTKPQADGFYRPLTFLSLWVDYRIFGEVLWGYHLQNLMLHMANAVLLFALARSLSLGDRTARWAAWLFAAAAVNFEAVMWPAARFDLLATFFILLALLAYMRYLRSRSVWAAALCAAAYLLGLLNKEVAYMFPVIAVALTVTGRRWGIPAANFRTGWLFALTIAGITATMVGIRIAVFGSLGGYPPAVAHAGHFALSGRTVWSVVSRVMLIPIIGVNTTAPVAAPATVAIALFAGFVLMTLLIRPVLTAQVRLLVALALISALPVANLAGWVGASMQHCRYLYFPTLFLLLAAASAFAEQRLGPVLLAVLLAANAAGALNNLWVYRTVQGRARTMAAAIVGDARQEKLATVQLVGVPREPQGVFYFYSELVGHLRRDGHLEIIDSEAGAADPSGKPAARLIYTWNPGSGTLSGPQRAGM